LGWPDDDDDDDDDDNDDDDDDDEVVVFVDAAAAAVFVVMSSSAATYQGLAIPMVMYFTTLCSVHATRAPPPSVQQLQQTRAHNAAPLQVYCATAT
jgi:mannose/fructose-specific phosphotransferase system component IIA